MKWPHVIFESLYAVPSRNGVYKPREFHGSGCRMVNMGELFGYDFISNQEMNRVELTDAELAVASLEDGDLLFGRRSLVEAGAGKCSLVVEPLESLTFESSIIRVRLDNRLVSPRYFYYYFQSPEGRGRIRSIVSGTNVKGIRGSDLRRLEVARPPKGVQERICTVLSAYDDLIENNTRRMALLEQAARLLYDEWFVRLRFPGHEHTRIIAGVPEGWERTTLGDRVVLNYGKALKADDRRVGDYPVYGSSGVVGTHEKPLVDGPGIIVGRKGNVGAVYWSTRSYYPIDTVFFIDSDASTLYLYYALKRMHFISTDVAVPGLNRDFAYSRPLLVPPANLMRAFLDTVGVFHEQLEKLGEINEKLRSARDLLLPRLMSGRIEV